MFQLASNKSLILPLLSSSWNRKPHQYYLLLAPAFLCSRIELSTKAALAVDAFGRRNSQHSVRLLFARPLKLGIDWIIRPPKVVAELDTNFRQVRDHLIEELRLLLVGSSFNCLLVLILMKVYLFLVPWPLILITNYWTN